MLFCLSSTSGKTIRGLGWRHCLTVLIMSSTTEDQSLERVYNALTRTVSDRRNVYPDRITVKKFKGMLVALATLLMATNGFITYGIVEYQRMSNATLNQKCVLSAPFVNVQNESAPMMNCSLPMNLSVAASGYSCQHILEFIKSSRHKNCRGTNFTTEEAEHLLSWLHSI